MKTPSLSFKDSNGLKLVTLILGGSLALAGCANPPVREVNAAKYAINLAVADGASDFSPESLGVARSKVSQAESLIATKKSRNYRAAKVLAEQATWDARVSQSSSQNKQAEIAVEQSRQDTVGLRLVPAQAQ